MPRGSVRTPRSPDQHLKRDEQIAFARRFGPLEFEMAAISNVRADGSLRVESDNDDMMKILKGNMGWHADSTYMPIQAKGAVFSAEVVPSVGGQTGFADMRAAYDALDADLKAHVETLQARHCFTTASRSSATRRRRPTAKKAATACTTAGAAAAPGEDAPGDRAQVAADRPPCPRHSRHGPGRVRALPAGAGVDFACQPPRLYHHDWAPGDAVLWDNRCLLHQATPWDMNSEAHHVA